MAKTTAKDFKLFREECQKWLDFFGIKGWEIHFRHKKADHSCRAQAWFNPQEDRVVVLLLALDWENDKIDSYGIRRAAFHEVMEVFLRRIIFLVNERSLTEVNIEEEKHHIIRTLENVVFDNFIAT